LLGAGLAALGQQLGDVLGTLAVLVAVVTADVLGDELVPVIEIKAVGSYFENQALAGAGGRHRVVVGVEGDAAAYSDN
jgi:hypothetical protein